MDSEKISIPYYVVYASDYIVFRSKLSPDEVVKVLDAIANICLFGESSFETDNAYEQKFFNRLVAVLEKNKTKYTASVENGKRGGRPRKSGKKNDEDWEEMLKFFGYSCICCGAKMSEYNPPTKDHIIPKSWGGGDDISNLQPLCRECNAKKCADNATDYRVNFDIPDYLKNKWKINLDKTYKKPVGFENENPDRTQTKPIKYNIKEYNKIENNIIEKDDIKKIDAFFDPLTDKCFAIYSENCKNLLPLKFEKRNKEIRELLSNYLYETNNDLEYFKEVCTKANEQKQICDVRLDFKGVLKNHISIYNEKFKKAEKGKVVSKLKFK